MFVLIAFHTNISASPRVDAVPHARFFGQQSDIGKPEISLALLAKKPRTLYLRADPSCIHEDPLTARWGRIFTAHYDYLFGKVMTHAPA
jgi:hypothetical protein